MKKNILILLTLLIIIVITIFIKPNDNKNQKLVISEVTHSIFYAPWYVSIEKDYFKEENIDIEVLLTPGADKVATSVLSNDADIGFSGPEATIYIYNNSQEKLLTFASLTKKDGQFIVGPCNLKNTFKIEDLKGKTVLAGRKGGMPLLMFKYALKQSNIDEKDINTDTSIEFSALSGAFISKQGEFVNLFEPNALNIEKQQYGCILSSLGNISGTVPYTTFYAKESFINNNKSLIKKFNKALNKGLLFVKENDSKTIATTIINQFPDTSIEDLTTIIERYKQIDAWYDNTTIIKEDFDRLIDIMLYGKTIENKIDTQLLYTNEFNE